jgi:hypothetical protein
MLSYTKIIKVIYINQKNHQTPLRSELAGIYLKKWDLDINGKIELVGKTQTFAAFIFYRNG